MTLKRLKSRRVRAERAAGPSLCRRREGSAGEEEMGEGKQACWRDGERNLTGYEPGEREAAGECQPEADSDRLSSTSSGRLSGD